MRRRPQRSLSKVGVRTKDAPGKRKERDEDMDAEAAPPAKRVSKMQPLQLGPKVFCTPDELYKYFSTLLTEQTLEQNINEAPALPRELWFHCAAPPRSWPLRSPSRRRLWPQYEHMVLEDLLRKGHHDVEGKASSAPAGSKNDPQPSR